MFIVVMGGLADRIGCLKILNLGFLLVLIGALLIALAPFGDLAVPLLMLGRIIQGISAACIMPSSLTLVKAYWEVKLVSVPLVCGLSDLGGGWFMCTLRWVSISKSRLALYFFACAALSLLGYVMCRGTHENSKWKMMEKNINLTGEELLPYDRYDPLQVLVTQGGDFGWTEYNNDWFMYRDFCVNRIIFMD